MVDGLLFGGEVATCKPAELSWVIRGTPIVERFDYTEQPRQRESLKRYGPVYAGVLSIRQFGFNVVGMRCCGLFDNDKASEVWGRGAAAPEKAFQMSGYLPR